MSRPRPRAWGRLGFFLRIAVSLGLVALLVSRLDTHKMLGFLRGADPWLVLLTLVTVLCDRGLMAGRWIWLLEALDLHFPRSRVVKIFFLSTFFGSFLPSGVGGEAVRALSLSRLSDRGVESVASVAMDRVLGMLSMLLTGLIALTVFYNVYPHPALLITAGAGSAVLLGGLAVLLSPRLHESLRRRWPGAPEVSGWRGWLSRATEAMARYRSRPGVLVLVLAFSMGVQVLRIFQAYLLSEAMSLQTPLIYFLCFIPPILIVTMLPISVGGWGTANLAYVGLFSSVGMDPDGAFVLSVLILALGVFGNLPGGVIYALEGFAASKAPDPDPT